MIRKKSVSVGTSASVLHEQGYAVIEQFLPDGECQEVLQSIEDYRKDEKLIQVDHQALLIRATKKFLTLNGQDIDENLPAVRELYTRINEVVNAATGKIYHPLENRAIGLSINITPPGGQFGWHYDRNEITAILYLNEVEEGQLELYPNYRFLLKDSHQGLKKWLQQAFDVLLRLELVRALFGQKAVVTPRVGTLCLMVASWCLHRVRPVGGGRDRVSVIFAYDIPGKMFTKENTKDYYGYR
jgi:hypothetical protein